MVGNLEDRLASVGLRYRRDDGEFIDTTMDLARIEALSQSVPVREFRWYKGKKHYSGWYWSSTTGSMVAYESRLELARILLADFDPKVCGIAARPFQMAEQAGAKSRTHVPDLLLLHRDRTVTVIDVKPAELLEDPVVTAVFEWAGPLVKMRGWRFEVWSGAEPTLVENVRFLAGFRRASVIDTSLLEPLAELAGTQGFRHHELRHHCSVGEILAISRLIALSSALEVPEELSTCLTLGTTLAGLPPAQREQVAARAAHLRDVLTEDGRRQADRLTDKASELGVTVRTLERWLHDYRLEDEAGLADGRAIGSRRTKVDARWDIAILQVLDEKRNASKLTRDEVMKLAAEQLERDFRDDPVRLPPKATAYRRFEELTRGTNAASGSTKGRRSIADRPKGVYGRLRATRPGEYLILDTQDLDVFAMEPVTCRWIGAQLTVAQDLFTRCIVGMRVTPVSTQSVDVAGVLYEAVAGRETPSTWPEEGVWPYHGVPKHLVFDETEMLTGPVCAPEALVVDHGKIFLSSLRVHISILERALETNVIRGSGNPPMRPTHHG